MNDSVEQSTRTITRILIAEDQRMAHTANLFGAHFPLIVEPVVYGITDRMAEEYQGGYWIYYSLDNGGFYMAPERDQVYTASCDNYFTGKLSADALGLAASLYAYSNCSFSRDKAFGRLMAEHYHLLREYMYTHPEVAAILGAID